MVPGPVPEEEQGFVGRIVDYLRDRWRLAKLPIKIKAIDMTVAGKFDHKYPGNTLILSRATANNMDDFVIYVAYNREDAIPVPLRQVMVLGFEWTELYFTWEAVADGAAEFIFGTEL